MEQNAAEKHLQSLHCLFREYLYKQFVSYLVLSLIHNSALIQKEYGTLLAIHLIKFWLAGCNTRQDLGQQILTQ